MKIILLASVLCIVSVVSATEVDTGCSSPGCNKEADAEIVCESLPHPTFGAKYCGRNEKLTVGRKCKFYCLSSGYVLTGSQIRECLKNGSWSGEETNCSPIESGVSTEKDVECEPPPPLINGSILRCPPHKKLKWGEACEFKCNRGFCLVGPSLMFCSSMGKLINGRNDKFPRCGACNTYSHLPNLPKATQVQQKRSRCQTRNGDCEEICDSDNGQCHCRCSCHKGFESTTDSRCVDIDECSRNELNKCSHNCHNTFGGYTCSCRPGFRIVSGGKCADIDECSRKELNECSHNCHNTFGGYSCSCRPGYRIVSGRQCTDINECSREELNECSHYCHNTIGGYTCSCRPGYWIVAGRKCEGCAKNSYKAAGEGRCIECPPHSYTDSEGKNSIADCICRPGYRGDISKGIPCTDINECEPDGFGCSDGCVNTPGSAHCWCPIGYELKEGNKTCTDIDECSLKNGGCDGFCNNTVGSFYCGCPNGYTSSETDLYTCNDIDECLENNGGCNQKCTNFPGGHFCSCDDGYRLDNSGKLCSPVVCPRPLPPRFSYMKCRNATKTKNQIAKDWDSFPEGAICSFKCNKGFKSTHSTETIKCRSSRWIGNIPQCVALVCPALTVPDNGEIHPKFCSTGKARVKQRCLVTCNPGYKLKGRFAFRCKNNLTWDYSDMPICAPVKVSPHISCPPDITVNLQPGKSSALLNVPQPTANMEYSILEPQWAKSGELMEFPAGLTEIKFVVSSPADDGRNDSCVTSIHVVDDEPPVFNGCPESFDVVASDGYGAFVQWEEPEVVDNVKVISVTKTEEPNSTLALGIHIVEYDAMDEAGNFASCSFRINVTRTECGVPNGPLHGDANCMDWSVGQLCSPYCDEGYMHYPDHDVSFYACNSEGHWSPSDTIPDCLEFYSQQPSDFDCSPMFERRTLNETGEIICIKCPAELQWSAKSGKCEVHQDSSSALQYPLSNWTRYNSDSDIGE